MSSVHKHIMPGHTVFANLSPTVSTSQRTIQPGEMGMSALLRRPLGKKTQYLFCLCHHFPHKMIDPILCKALFMHYLI